jgi:peptide-methionine (S)-S-oxide reductase
MSLFTRRPPQLIEASQALPGRSTPIPVPEKHFVLGTPLLPPFPEGFELALFGMGCFWGAERVFWQADGVYSTQVGYAGGFTPNPTYEEVCSWQTGHAEVVRVVFDPARTSYQNMLQLFFENHDPTQYMRQGNDRGPQYRSGIWTYDDAQLELARATAKMFEKRLEQAGYGEVVSEITPAKDFYYAEEYHQQYLAKNPWGYCGLGGTGVSCPVGLELPSNELA